MVGAVGASDPSAPKNQRVAVVFGTGQRSKFASKRGSGTPGSPPAPFSNRIRTRGNFSKSSLASASVFTFANGSGGSPAGAPEMAFWLPPATPRLGCILLRHLSLDEDRQELRPAREHRGIERVG